MLKRLITFAVVILTLSACQSAYYSAMEKVGFHKRDILVDRVEEAKDTQEETKEQFKSALEKFQSVRQFDGGKLEEVYNSLNDEYESSLALSNEITSRIKSIENVSEALFEEWSTELEQISNTSMRQKSNEQLLQTKREYNKLIRAMKKAESSVKPVLTIFKDQVLFLKHNLNARAIASLKNELGTVDSDVNALLSAMQQAINESNAFIDELRGG